MHCDQCGKENRSSSKFCRHCGSTISESSPPVSVRTIFSKKLSWKNPAILILVGLIIIGGLSYGGFKAYAYFQIESKINSAKKLQAVGDFQKSIEMLDSLTDKKLTGGQKIKIENIKTSDQKFIVFKISFDNAIAITSATSTSLTSAQLQGALKELQSIESDYPGFKEVQAEIVKAQNALVATLQNEADKSKKAAVDAAAQAEKNRQAAAAAQAAKERAEQNAQQAANDAARAAANAQVQAAAAKAEEVKRSFRNELTTGYNSYSQGITYYSSAIKYSNSGDSLLAVAQANSASAVLNSAYSAVYDLNSRFSGMPSDYYTAASNMVSAINNLSSAIDLLVKSEGTYLDYSSSINSYKDIAAIYAARVKAFLNANYY